MLRRPACLLEAVTVLKVLHGAEPFATTIDVFARNKQWAKTIEAGGYLLPLEYLDAANAIDSIQGIFRDFHITKVPCHNDLTPGNFILSEGKLQLIDFEYGGNNDPVWDLAYLAMEADFTQSQSEFMLRAYFGDKMTDDVVRRFYLYQPVIEYTVALWCRLQIAHGNIISESDELAAQERKRFASYQALMKSDLIQKELNQSIPDGAMHAVEKDDDVAEKPRLFSCCRR
jgi:thiamine kinase-like enzyme